MDMENQIGQVEGSALSAITEGEINTQVATAKRYPRSLDRFRKNALSLATNDRAIAARCFYKLKRAGKVIEGPSVRLAEICIASWQNLRAAARIIAVENDFVRSQGVCMDLENNTAISMEVMRRITNKDGIRYNDDMIGVTCNAANAISLRNSIFKVIPYAYVQELFVAVKKAAVGDEKTLTQRRGEMLTKYGEKGVKDKQLLQYIGRNHVDEIDLQDMEDLIGLYNAIEDGDTTITEALGAAGKSMKPTIKAPTERKATGKKTEKAEPKAEPPKKEEKPLTKEEFEMKANKVVETLRKQGLTVNEIGMLLVRRALPYDFREADSIDRPAILKLLNSYIEAPSA